MNPASGYQQQPQQRQAAVNQASATRRPPGRPLLNPGNFSPTAFADPVANVPYGSPIQYQPFANRRTAAPSYTSSGSPPGYSQARSRPGPSTQRQGSSPPLADFPRPSMPRADMFAEPSQSPVPHHPYYAPPPPFMQQQHHHNHHMSHRGAPNVFDHEPMVAEHDVMNHRLSPVATSPLAVPGPHHHFRDPASVHQMYRASSAVGDGYYGHTARQLIPSSSQQPGSRPSQQQLHQHQPYPRAASTAPGHQVGKIQYTNYCNHVIEDRDPNTNRLIAQYRCGALLGTGGFAKVFDVVDLHTGERFACKIIDKVKLSDAKKRMKFFAEVDIHRRLTHPNILHFYKTFHDEWYHYMLLERCGKESLMELSKARTTFTTDEIQHIMAQLLAAVEYLHSKNILHRDLKLGNVMVDAAGNMKIGDFGFATQLSGSDERKYTMCGTPNYIAPEVLSARPNANGYSYEVDVWSLGVIFYTLAVGTPPFETKDLETTYQRIQACEYMYPHRCNASESLRSLVSLMLQKRPEARLSLVAIRAHRFFRSPPCPSTAPLSLVGLDADISPPESRNGSPFVQNFSSPFAYLPSPGLTSYSVRRTDDSPTPNLAAPAPAPRPSERPAAAASPTAAAQHVEQAQRNLSSSTSSSARRSTSQQTASPAISSPEVILVSSPNRSAELVPTPPNVLITCFVTFPKYGHGFLLAAPGSSSPSASRVAGLLNDRSKIVYDSLDDKVWYFARVKGNSSGGSPVNTDDDRGRSPLASEPPSAGAFYDERHDFSAASVTLSMGSVRVVPQSSTGDSNSPNALFPSAFKKFTIVKFLQQYMCGQRSDVCPEENPIFKPGMDASTTVPSSIFSMSPPATPISEAAAAPGGACSVRRQLLVEPVVVYAKGVHLCPLSDLKFKELRTCETIQSATVRLSDGSYQVSLRSLDGLSFMPLLAPVLVSKGNASSSPIGDSYVNVWSSIDLVWYGGADRKHVMLALRHGSAQAFMSIFDPTTQFATDSSSKRTTVSPSALVATGLGGRNGGGAMSAGNTQLVLPPILTRAISDLLSNVQAPAGALFQHIR